jgi:hypothetical protein
MASKVRTLNNEMYVTIYLRFFAIVCRSRVSSGSIVSDYGLDDRAIGG